MKDKLIVVVGASGNQGQSVIKSLTKKGYKIRALLRNTSKINELLKKDNIEIYRGDLKDKNSLKNLFNDAYGLYFALPPTKESVTFGKTLLDIAKNSNLKHIIYSSVGRANVYSKVDHFCYKKEIEDYLKNLGKPYTILRPAGYMDEFANPKSIRVITGLLKLYISQTHKFQLISIQDIGVFAGIAFDNPDKYLGIELEISGDELSISEVFEKIKKIKNKKMSPKKIPGFVKFFLPKTMKQMFTFYAEEGWHADLKSLRKENTELLTFEDWLKATNLYEKQ